MEKIPSAKAIAWSMDTQGLPVLELGNWQPSPSNDPIPYTLLGNHGITAFVDALGRVQLHTGERAWACLNGSRKENLTLHEILISVDNGREVKQLPSQPVNGRFGCGFTEFTHSFEGVHIRRTLSVAPSEACGERKPIVYISLQVHNTTDTSQKLTWKESFGARYDFSFRHNFPFHKSRVDYPVSVEVEEDQVSARFLAKPHTPLVLAEENEPAWQEGFPPRVHLARLSPKAKLDHRIDTPTQTAWLTHQQELTLAAGGETEVLFAVGYAQEDLDWTALLAHSPQPGKEKFREQWRAVIPRWTDEADPELPQEMQWHAHCLHAMATWSAWYEETFVPQGTVYEYALGCSAVIRDHLQHALPLCHYQPELAASILRFTGKHTDPWGHIREGDEGANQHPLGAGQKSDSQIYALMAVAEFLSAKGDPGHLTRPIHFLGSPRQTDLLDCTARWLRFLRDEVKTGPHGYIRLCCSDWNDCFYEFFKNIPYHRIFSIGESLLNSAMAIVVLQRLVEALESNRRHPTLAPRSADVDAIIAAARVYRSELLQPVLKLMEGRSFIPRAYVGDEVIGDTEMFFEPQPWLLMIPELHHRHATIWQAIRERVWDNEPCGARQRETPGSRENGGIWFALNGPLGEALAQLDPDVGRQALEKLTCRQRAKTYPDRWIGQWSIGDSFNSHHHPDPELSGKVSTYLSPMPLFCAHSHAWPLYLYSKYQNPTVPEKE